MSEHTQGKIHASILPHTDEWELIGNDYIRPDYLEVPLIAGGLKGEDARRLAAAWNACEGMTTEAIEALAGIGSLGDLKASELDTANARIAKLEALVAERDAMLGKRPCQNSRCNELNAARDLLREVIADTGIVSHIDACQRAQEYLDACDMLEGK